MVVESNAIGPFLLWEGLELLQRTRAKGAPRAASLSSFPAALTFGDFTECTPALEDTLLPGIYAEYNGIALHEPSSLQGSVFESAPIAPAVIASRQQ